MKKQKHIIRKHEKLTFDDLIGQDAGESLILT